MKSLEKSEIIKGIQLLMKVDADINAQIACNNHLLKKNNEFKLETIYKSPIELKVLSSSKSDLTISEFLVYAGGILKFDYVDLLFGKYNLVSYDQFQLLIKNSNQELNEFYSKESIILTVDETSVNKTFLIESESRYCLIHENWQI